VKPYDTTDKNHDVNKGQGRSEKSHGSKDADKVHVTYPRAVYLLVEHEGRHIVLFLIELVNVFKLIKVKIGPSFLFPRLTKLLILKSEIGQNCRYDRKYQIDNNKGQ